MYLLIDIFIWICIDIDIEEMSTPVMFYFLCILLGSLLVLLVFCGGSWRTCG